MDIVEFAEKFMNIKLWDCQKELLRTFEKLPRGAKITSGPNGRVYIYVDQPAKELIPNGSTHDSKH